MKKRIIGRLLTEEEFLSIYLVAETRETSSLSLFCPEISQLLCDRQCTTDSGSVYTIDRRSIRSHTTSVTRAQFPDEESC